MARIAWVTGCSRGLGREMVRGLVAHGWTVAGCARSEGAIGDLEAELGVPHYFGATDVSVDAAVAEFCEAARARVGVPDLLINNAALINAPAPLWEVESAEFRSLLEVNILGMAHMIRHVVPSMIAQDRGVVVNFSSGWGRSTSPEVAPYCATKWAVEGLTQALAQELPEGLAAVALNPGIIDTVMLRKTWGEGAGAYESPEQWGLRAVPVLEALGPADNGQALSV